MLSEATYKTKYGEGCLSHLTHVAKVSDHRLSQILTPNQILQRLPIALAEAKAKNLKGNTSEKLLNEIRQIIFSFVSYKKNY